MIMMYDSPRNQKKKEEEKTAKREQNS